ncbi:putative Glycogen (Starch) synthase [groundwater metagenome]|uniref:Putative Glycogen (Starch) synthase n=1 Tax=groundwater metagenome TaxID=717931 RepID=A0A098EDY5_9ZZZZ
MKLFEISYEVCNKVGGIYTVLKTKAPYIVEHYGRENYIMLGFYNQKLAIAEFNEKTPDTELSKIFAELKSKGIECHYGEWLLNGYPQVILLDIKNFWKERDKIKELLWKFYNVDSLFSSYEFDEPLLWSFACGMLIEKMYKIFPDEDKFIAHFHEWLSGAGMLYLKMQNLPVATVFTTHATIIGRTLANTGIDLYSKIYEGLSKGQTFPVEESKKFGIADKHTMEIASATNADVFSTVSEVTGKEARYFFHKKPDIILPNGIDIEQGITIDEITIRRRENRKIMRRFLNAYFLRYFNIDTNRIRTLFISGRYEFRNKGIDLFIKALGNLNRKLKEAKEKNERLNFDAVIAFLFIPSDVKGENLRVMRNVMIYENIESIVDNEILVMKNKIISDIVSGKINKMPDETNKYDKFFSNEFINACRDIFAHFDELRGQEPPLSAFDLRSENDAILKSLKAEGLENKEEDVVKVINYPVYLSPRDMFINLDYNTAISAFDMGIFPSYYEPWGYTPLEAAKYGVITITTDLAGFGNFIKKKDEGGIYVIQRMGKDDEYVVENLTKKILEILNFSDDERVKARMRARELATFCDWKILVNNYFEAHKIATEKMKIKVKK